jgi:hypothetical protein
VVVRYLRIIVAFGLQVTEGGKEVARAEAFLRAYRRTSSFHDAVGPPVRLLPLA